MHYPANSVIVLDFETTGLSPDKGDRAIEIGAVKLQNGKVTDTYQQLMNPGFRVSGFIEELTGITNAMLQTAPHNEDVMADFANFLGDTPFVAHNASFDKRFLDAELARIHLDYSGPVACSMLLARRLIQEAPTHKLGELVRFKHIENDGTVHRALADSQMTARLWMLMIDELEQQGILSPSFALIQKICKTNKFAVRSLLANYREKTLD